MSSDKTGQRLTLFANLAVLAGNAPLFLGSHFALAWSAENRENFTPELRKMFDAVVADISPDAILESYERIKAQASKK